MNFGDWYREQKLLRTERTARRIVNRWSRDVDHLPRQTNQRRCRFCLPHQDMITSFEKR